MFWFQLLAFVDVYMCMCERVRRIFALLKATKGQVVMLNWQRMESATRENYRSLQTRNKFHRIRIDLQQISNGDRSTEQKYTIINGCLV